MAAPVVAIHVFGATGKDVDGRDEPGHDDEGHRTPSWPPLWRPSTSLVRQVKTGRNVGPLVLSGGQRPRETVSFTVSVIFWLGVTGGRRGAIVTRGHIAVTGQLFDRDQSNRPGHGCMSSPLPLKAEMTAKA
jgi:hypothetical protein